MAACGGEVEARVKGGTETEVGRSPIVVEEPASMLTPILGSNLVLRSCLL